MPIIQRRKAIPPWPKSIAATISRKSCLVYWRKCWRRPDRWRRWAKYGFYQLDMIRPVLCAENRARRWYLDRLGDGLGKHHYLLLLRRRVGDVSLDEDDRLRVEAVIETRLAIYRDRARKLHPYIYAQKGVVFGAAVAEDLAKLTFDNVVVLPRSA